MSLSACTVNLFIFISGASLINMATNLLSYPTKVIRYELENFHTDVKIV